MRPVGSLGFGFWELGLAAYVAGVAWGLLMIDAGLAADSPCAAVSLALGFRDGDNLLLAALIAYPAFGARSCLGGIFCGRSSNDPTSEHLIRSWLRRVLQPKSWALNASVAASALNSGRPVSTYRAVRSRVRARTTSRTCSTISASRIGVSFRPAIEVALHQVGAPEYISSCPAFGTSIPGCSRNRRCSSGRECCR